MSSFRIEQRIRGLPEALRLLQQAAEAQREAIRVANEQAKATRELGARALRDSRARR